MPLNLTVCLKHPIAFHIIRRQLKNGKSGNVHSSKQCAFERHKVYSRHYPRETTHWRMRNGILQPAGEGQWYGMLRVFFKENRLNITVFEGAAEVKCTTD